MNPEVKELKKRVAQTHCMQCTNYEPKECRCGLRDLYLDGRNRACESFSPARVVKWVKLTKQEDDEQ